MNKIFGIILILLVVQASAIGQDYDDDDDEIRKGITLGIGYGFGYSKHAGEYEESTDYRTLQFSGLRAIVLESKIGWRISNRFEIYGNAQYTPSNTTISPYRSLFYGSSIAYYFKSHPKFSIHGGFGKYNSNIKGIGGSGSGNLVSAALSWQASGLIHFDIKLLAGKMNKSALQPNPFGTSEINVSFGAVCKY